MNLGDRNAQIARMFLAGHSKQEIAYQMGISRERVRQILGPKHSAERNAQILWSPEMDEIIASHYGLIITRHIAEILSEKVGQRVTKNMVVGRANRVGLTRPPQVHAAAAFEVDTEKASTPILFKPGVRTTLKEDA